MNRDIVVFGKGQLAIDVCEYLISKGHTIVAVPVMPEPDWAPSFDSYAQNNGLKVFSWNKFRETNDEYTLGVSVYFDRLFKKKEIAKFRLLLNIHNSFLPKYRGMNPINWALENQEESHGVTIHEIIESIDAGRIYAQVKFPIDHMYDDVIDVYERCLNYGLVLFKRVFDNLNTLHPLNQNEDEASYYSKTDFDKLSTHIGFRRENHA